MRRLCAAAILAALVGSSVSFSAVAAGEEALGEGDGSTQKACHLPRLDLSTDRLFSGKWNNWSALSRASYGFSYGGTWETSKGSLSVQGRKSIYAHH